MGPRDDRRVRGGSPMSAIETLELDQIDGERPPNEELARSYFGVDEVRLAFGGLQVLQGVSFEVRRGEERMIVERTENVIERLGLGDYSKKFASELSYGTLRLTELATILAVEPELILLDEPSSGIAQKETEALGPLLMELRDELQATFL